MLRAFWVTTLVSAALAVTAAAATSAESPPARVTLIGDSIATAIELEPGAKATLAKGIDLDLEVAPCRRLVGESCPYQGSRAPTLVDLLPTLRLGQTVVVAVGYNDYESGFASTIETTLAALRSAGVQNILWVTLRADRQSYVRMNDLIREAATRRPELTVVDWNVYSRSHPDWFQPDGLHLRYAGAVALATLIHRRLDEIGVVASSRPRALAVATTGLPAGRIGRPYAARVRTTGGTAPIRWKRVQGTIPAGLALKPNGALVGTPRSAGKHSLLLRATDARGRVVARRFTITVAS